MERRERQDRPRAESSFLSLSSLLTFLPSSLLAATWTYQSLLELVRRKAKTGSDQIVEISYVWKQGNLRRELENGELASFLLCFSSP